MTKALSAPLVLGDVVILLLFSLGGMAFHKVDGLWVGQLFRIGWPFFTGYIVAAVTLGAWINHDFGKRYFQSGAWAWIVGIGLGILLRVVSTGRVPLTSFIVVTFTFTGLLFLLWRLLYRTIRRSC